MWKGTGISQAKAQRQKERWHFGEKGNPLMRAGKWEEVAIENRSGFSGSWRHERALTGIHHNPESLLRELTLNISRVLFPV